VDEWRELSYKTGASEVGKLLRKMSKTSSKDPMNVIISQSTKEALVYQRSWINFMFSETGNGVDFLKVCAEQLPEAQSH
jgi:hypothetical protein